MIEDGVQRVSKAGDTRERDAAAEGLAGAAKPALDDEMGIGRIMSAIEDGNFSNSELAMLRKQWQSNPLSPAPPPPHPPTRRTPPQRPREAPGSDCYAHPLPRPLPPITPPPGEHTRQPALRLLHTATALR